MLHHADLIVSAPPNGKTHAMKKSVEADLLEALVKLDAAVKAMPTASPRPNLLPLFQRIDDLAGHLPFNASPNLLHFLQKKSYEKARLFLEGRTGEISKGACGR